MAAYMLICCLSHSLTAQSTAIARDRPQLLLLWSLEPSRPSSYSHSDSIIAMMGLKFDDQKDGHPDSPDSDTESLHQGSLFGSAISLT